MLAIIITTGTAIIIHYGTLNRKSLSEHLQSLLSLSECPGF